MTLPHCFCLCSLLCVVFRINVILSIYFYLDLKYTRTLTPKWIVFIFLILWKLGEGGKMDKVLVMLAAGNAARKVNSIQKTMTFSFSSQKGGYNHLFFLLLYLFFFWKQYSILLSVTINRTHLVIDCVRCCYT